MQIFNYSQDVCLLQLLIIFTPKDFKMSKILIIDDERAIRRALREILEFEKFDDQYALDILWEHADPAVVRAELDLYWVTRGGVDPVRYVKQLGERVQLVHLKDMEAGPEQRFAPVGTGTLDVPALSEACAEDAGGAAGRHVGC